MLWILPSSSYASPFLTIFFDAYLISSFQSFFTNTCSLTQPFYYFYYTYALVRFITYILIRTHPLIHLHHSTNLPHSSKLHFTLHVSSAFAYPCSLLCPSAFAMIAFITFYAAFPRCIWSPLALPICIACSYVLPFKCLRSHGHILLTRCPCLSPVILARCVSYFCVLHTCFLHTV